MEFILILYIYAGAMASGDSVTLFAVPHFQTIQECNAAGEASKSLTSGSSKSARFLCVKQTQAK